MAFGRLERRKPETPISDINMTPLIDVMLVLLVIFMIGAPLMSSSLKLELPKSPAATAGASGAVVAVPAVMGYNALVKIGVSGQASIDRVAGPVGEALIMTAIGLFVAVPAVMGYNWLIRRNKAIMDATRSFAGDLHSVLIAGKR